MLPRALLVLLAVMNVGVAAWWVAHPAAPRTDPVVQTPAGVPGLRLPAEDAATATNPSAPATRRCHRFGPYSDAATLGAAREAAAGITPAFEVVTMPGPAPEAWRVAAPPPPDGDSAALASRIAAAGFDDFLIVAEGAEAGSIALGRFSTPEAAGRRQQALRDAGFASQVHPIGGNTDWLLLALPDGQPLAAARAALSALQAQSHPCPD